MDFSSIIKKGAPSVEPHELTPITDEDDPLYDRRLDLPIKSEAVLNFACRGQIQPISVRPRTEKELVIVDGLQRWKRAIVINHLTGHRAYKGDIGAIKYSIASLTGTSMGTRIVEECPNGIKLLVSIYRADEKQSVLAKAAANVFREDDARIEQIRKAHQLAKHGYDEEEIAANMGKSKGTITRYLLVDPDRPKAKKERSKTRKPGVSKVRAAYENMDADDSGKLVLGWALGEVKVSDLLKDYPRLSVVLAAKRKAA